MCCKGKYRPQTSPGPMEHGKSIMNEDTCILSLRVQAKVGGTILFIMIEEQRVVFSLFGLDNQRWVLLRGAYGAQRLHVGVVHSWLDFHDGGL
jgi:hypothetical protein